MTAHSLPRFLLCVVLATLPACSPGCFLKPDEPFDAARVVAPPDYAQPSSWAALPTLRTNAKITPEGVPEATSPAPADVFYVHPTAWFDKEIWNDTFKSKKTDEVVNQIVIANQASAFNACCKVYAPRYRQSSIAAFYGERDQAAKSFAIAYDDVERSFRYFMEHYSGNRPFIIASHSQGSMHAMRLLALIDREEAWRGRLVAAYIPGFGLPMSYYGEAYTHLKPCREPEQIGCIASWDTYRQGAKVGGLDPLVYWRGDRIEAIVPTAARQCTNPISWMMDGAKSPREAHLGAVEMKVEGGPISFSKLVFFDDPLGVTVTGLKAPRPTLLTAQCVDGVLRVPDVAALDYPEQETEPGNYHLLDYELFYMNIRQNAYVRTMAWLAAQKPAPPSP